MVVPTLNGVEAADRLADALGSHHVAIGTARIIVHISAPGHIRHIGAEPTLVFGERTNERTARAERFRDAVREAGMAAEIPADVNVALWQKFLFVVPVGEVGAVTRVPLGLIRDNPESRSLLEGAMREIEVLARARGVALPDDVVSRSLQFADGLPADAIASLHRDLEDGRRSELEAWTGAVVRLARAAGVAAPIHDVLYAALIPLERRACGDLPAA